MGEEVYDSLSGLMFYSFNMPLFFFVSGFLAYKAQIDINYVLKKTWQKFVFLVVPAIAFYMFMSVLNHKNPLDFVTEGSGGYWFTITLWECFLLYYIISSVIRNHDGGGTGQWHEKSTSTLFQLIA